MSDPNRTDWEKRVELAKKIAAAIIKGLNDPRAGLVPAELREACADMSVFLVELARLSHAKFDMHPYDFPELVRRVEALESWQRVTINQKGSINVDDNR